MQSLPIVFHSEARADKNFENSWAITSGSSQAVCAIPIEFGGKGNGFSPEDLFLQAAINCFVGTFKVVAKLSKISFAEIHVSGKLTVDKSNDDRISMKTIDLNITVLDADRLDRIESIVAKSIRDGFILNSLKSEINYTLNLRTSPSVENTDQI